MNLDWLHFTPWPALAGGVLIGLAAAMLLRINGRIAGISGIIGALLQPACRDRQWRLAFVAGLLLAPTLYKTLAPLPVSTLSSHPVLIILAGLLVGIGTRYGAGCTSGHGICGLSRLSPRSMVATLAFMATGFACVFVVRHLLGG